jgi:anti-sigma-K factor RskA
MDRVTPHSEIQELLGAYALDAVDADEAALVEQHLAGCPECRAELAQHREVIAFMGDVRTAPPPGVWDRIVTGLQERPSPLRADRPEPSTSGRGPASAPERRSVSMRTFTVVVAAAAVIVAALGIEVARLDARTNRLPRVIAAQALVNAYESATTQAAARRVDLHGTGITPSVPAVVLADGTGFLDGRPLPRLADDRTYQLWGLGAPGAAPISLAIIGHSPGIQQFGVPAGVGTLAITAENAGGAVAPTSTPVVAGQLVA